MQIQLPNNVSLILSKLNENGFEANIVGGCVRDILLGKEPHDWDICTDAMPEQIIECFNNYDIIDNGIKHGTVGVIIDKNVYEITTYRIDGEYNDCRHPNSVTFTNKLSYDLSRRDFTVNAMAFNLKDGLTDLFGGQADLKSGAIRCVGDPDKRFKEDALRIIRALRFASVYSFSIEIKTADAILRNAGLLKNISEERITSEFNRLLCGNTAPYILNRFRRVIAVFIPEIEVMFNFDQNNPHHNKTLWKHTTSAISHIDNDLILRLTMFFHDIGKPLAQKYDEVKKLCHYKGHNKFSAAITDNIMRRLKYPNDVIDKVKTLILFHDIRFSDNKRQIKHVMSAIGKENFQLLIKVQRADLLAQSMYKREEKLEKFNLACETFSRVVEEEECFKLSDLAVNGHDLIRLGITNGKDIGNTLKLLLSLVIDEKLDNEKKVLTAKAKEINNL